jgi:hypothetical protein
VVNVGDRGSAGCFHLCVSLSLWGGGVTAGHREAERLPASSLLLLQGLALQEGLYQAGHAYSVRLFGRLGAGMLLECVQQRTGL